MRNFIYYSSMDLLISLQQRKNKKKKRGKNSYNEKAYKKIKNKTLLLWVLKMLTICVDI